MVFLAFLFRPLEEFSGPKRDDPAAEVMLFLASCLFLLGGFIMIPVEQQTHDVTVTAIDSKTTLSEGDNRKKIPLGAALQIPQNCPFALF